MRVVRNAAYTTGMASSVRVGLASVSQGRAEGAMVMLVDLPEVTRAAADRLATRFRSASAPASLLARAAYRGQPGHPVLIGRDHFRAVSQGVAGDAGARGYLSTQNVELVECGDIGGGRDVDTVQELRWP
jgi:CTP:molybdopterin cytidylyltransferase MocA